MSPYSPCPLPRGLPTGQLTPGILNGSSAQGIKRLRDTPPEERMRNARRAVKRLRHETRYQLAPMCFLIEHDTSMQTGSHVFGHALMSD